jgi:hypothetical protein
VSHLLVVAGGGGDNVAEGQVGERGLHGVRIHPCFLFPFALRAPASSSAPAAVAGLRLTGFASASFGGRERSEVLQLRAQVREAVGSGDDRIRPMMMSGR